jgi:hypothetical protein
MVSGMMLLNGMAQTGACFNGRLHAIGHELVLALMDRTIEPKIRTLQRRSLHQALRHSDLRPRRTPAAPISRQPAAS